jgi:hypothetical protein
MKVNFDKYNQLRESSSLLNAELPNDKNGIL